MANSKKKRHHSPQRNRSHSRSHSHNPAVRRRHHPSFRRRRAGRNPSIGGFQAQELIKLALGAAGGTLATKYATQLILQDKNNGPTGYAVMAAVAVALGWLSAKFLGRDVATGVVAGGASAVVLRIFQENVSGSTPATMSGLGDPDFLGEYQSGTYPVPGWGYGQPAALPAAVAPAIVGPAMSGAVPAVRAARSTPRQ